MGNVQVKSLNEREIKCAIASASVCAVKFMILFARHQQLFDIAEKHRLTSIRIFSSLDPVRILSKM